MILAIPAASAVAFLAQAAPSVPAQPSAGPNMPIMLVLMMVMMYFILIRPQRKKQKEQETLQKALSAGDEIVTIGGAHGVVVTVHEKTVIVRVAEGKIEYDRSAVALKVNKTEVLKPE